MTLPTGAHLGPYEILSPLGAGGMGEVYRARDPKLGRDVAIKVLPETVAKDAERLARFEREARALAALNHPGIVTIFSIEESGDTRYLAMELVEGESLDTLIASGGLPLPRFLDLSTPLAEALSAAHERGIVHRDLKPGNVMVTRDGRIKVLDFGLARVEGPDSDPNATNTPTQSRADLTGEGQVFGTVAYMSPEQARGGRVDARSDVFSLGVVLYQMLTGERPFQGASSVDLISSILRDRPPSVSELRADLPPHLGRIVRRCLEKEPRNRYQTSRDVYNELKELRAETSASPATSRPASGPVRTEERFVAIAVLPFSDMSPAKDQDYLCEGMAEEVMNALVRIEGIRVASRTSAFRASREEKDLAAIGRVLSVEQVLEGSVRTSGNRLRVTARLSDVATGYQVWSERFDRELEDVFAVQDEIAAGVVDAVKARLAPGARTIRARPQPRNLDAYRSYLQGQHLRYAKEDYAGAIRAFQEAVRLDPTHAPSWTGIAEGLVLSAWVGLIPAVEGCAEARKALATAAELQGESADGFHGEAFVAMIERRWKDLEATVRRAVELQPTHVPSLGLLGMCLSLQQRPDEAEPVFERAREADPLASFPYMLTALGLLSVGRPREAHRYAEQALIFEKDDVSALNCSTLANVALGHFEEGIAAARRAVALSHGGPHLVGLLGWALATAGRKDEARTLLEELRTRPADAPQIVSEGWLLGALGEIDAAFEVFARAEDQYQGWLVCTRLPGFDPLRGDPRFTAMVSRLGLPPA